MEKKKKSLNNELPFNDHAIFSRHVCQNHQMFRRIFARLSDDIGSSNEFVSLKFLTGKFTLRNINERVNASFLRVNYPFTRFICTNVCMYVVKDARSVSLYIYNRSQILQYAKYTKYIHIANGIAKYWTNNVFWGTKLKLNNNKTTKSNIKTGTSCTQSGCVTTAPASQLSVTIVVKLFNCFDAMGRNVNKQSRICRLQIFNKFIFSVIHIFTCMNNYIWQFVIFTGVGFHA